MYIYFNWLTALQATALKLLHTFRVSNQSNDNTLQMFKLQADHIKYWSECHDYPSAIHLNHIKLLTVL